MNKTDTISIHLKFDSVTLYKLSFSIALLKELGEERKSRSERNYATNSKSANSCSRSVTQPLASTYS